MERRDFLKTTAASIAAFAVPFPVAAVDCDSTDRLLDMVSQRCEVLKIYSGPMPFSPELEPWGDCLCELSLDCTKPAKNGLIPARWSGIAQHDGECGFMRVLDQHGKALLDSSELAMDGPIFVNHVVELATIHGPI